MEGKLDRLFLKRGPIKKIGVVGMGYVGIPSAFLFAGCSDYDFVYGFQRNSKTSGYKISMLNSGVSPLKGEEPGLEELIEDVVSKDKFRCISDFSKIADCDAVTLTIQTPFKSREDLIPDFTPLTEGLRNTGRYLTSGTLVVLESTVTPGTTQGLAREILEEESGLVAGEDFGLAHAPERVMVGRLLQNIQEHDRIVGGINDASTDRASELYRQVLTKGEIIPMNATAAEVTKTAENTFRDLQIAAANQLALYCEAMGVNFYDVRKGIDSLKGEGITRAVLWPGAGVGGHCLTKDTYHLERGISVANVGSLDFPERTDSLFVLARKINDFMPEHMFHLTKEGLARAGKKIRGSKIALLGWAFIANSDDARDTPSEIYYNLCKKEGAGVKIHDPYVRNYPGVEISSSLEEVTDYSDVIAVMTGHREYYDLKPSMIAERATNPVIVDGRNVIVPEQWIEEDFIYRGIGRGDYQIPANRSRRKFYEKNGQIKKRIR